MRTVKSILLEETEKKKVDKRFDKRHRTNVCLAKKNAIDTDCTLLLRKYLLTNLFTRDDLSGMFSSSLSLQETEILYAGINISYHTCNRVYLKKF